MATRPYKESIGALAWLELGTRPNVAFASSSLARFDHNPGHVGRRPTSRAEEWGNNRVDI